MGEIILTLLLFGIGDMEEDGRGCVGKQVELVLHLGQIHVV